MPPKKFGAKLFDLIADLPNVSNDLPFRNLALISLSQGRRRKHGALLKNVCLCQASATNPQAHLP